MKIIDGVKLKGKPVKIPDCSRDDLPKFFVEMGFKAGAEIGVHKGAFTEKFCQAGLTMYAIDPWEADKQLRDNLPDQKQQDLFYEHAQRTLAPYKNCTIIRKTSMDALADFDNGSLDFVYIDADHRFPRVAEDIYGWYAKVKHGGVIAGHDYFDPVSKMDREFIQVKPVVDAFVEAYKINCFYTFGLLAREKRKSNADRHLSWMIIKE